MVRKLLLMGFSLMLTNLLLAQSQTKWPLQISVFNESTAIPFTRFIPTPLHPGIQIGTSRPWNQNQTHVWYQTGNLSYFYHNHLYQAVTLGSQLGYDCRLGFGLNLKALIGLGYMLAMNTQEVYEFENGQYHSTKNSAMSKSQTTISLGLGYRLQPKNEHSCELFVLYQAGVIYPFSQGFIPAMTQTNVHLGISIPLFTKQ